jgi:hypothetical protein
MKSKKEIVETICQRIAEVEETIAHYAQCGDWQMVNFSHETLAMYKNRLEELK